MGSMVQRQQHETVKQAKERAFLTALKECRSPEEAAVRLGVSISTVMRFKRKQKGARR